MKLVASLDELGSTDLAPAGGKGANLGELVRLGLPVPAGFVVTTEAYATAAESAGLHLDIDGLEAGADSEAGAEGEGAVIRSALEAVSIPGEIRDAISAAYAGLGGGAVAVRSSATAEDLPGAAFAGQQDTYLNVVGEEAVLDAVRRCWASLWTDRAIAYRRKRGIDSREVRIAVVVQGMVDADTAGVMFTADPVTGHRERIVVDAGAGLGEAVVSGLVTPDHYVLDAKGRLLEWSAGRREVVVRGTAGGGVVHETRDQDGSGAERLPDHVLAELARLATIAERHFGRPQDLEWAYADGRVHLLQARPMTALPPPPLRLNLPQRRLGAMFMEYLPVRPYPIDATTWLPYGPAGLMGKVLAHFGIREAFDNFLPEVDGVVDRIVPPSPRPTVRALLTPFRVFSLARRYDPARWTQDPRFADFRERVDALAAEDVRAMPWERLLRVPREALDLVRPIADLRISYLPGTGLSLLRLVVALRLLGRRALFGELIAGRTRTSDANDALEALAGLVRADPLLHKALAGLDGPESTHGKGGTSADGTSADRTSADRTAAGQDVSWLAEFGGFQEAFDAFLREYGHRETTSPLLVTPPTWGESPVTVLGMVKVLAERPDGAAAGARAEREKPSGTALDRLLALPRLRRPRRQARMRHRVERARAAIAFREDSHFYFTQPLPILRRALLEIGRRLAEAGVLDHPEDLFHLRLEELEGCGDPAAGIGATEREALRRAVRNRRARREELTGVPLINAASVFPRPDSGDALVVGAPAAAGQATGPVKVIRGPEEFGELRAGDVLVCPYTNPSWTPLFQRAAAVVGDAGGSASHAAIVAREYAIPAVMGTADGTRVLTDGQVVTVDGTTGRVTSGS